MVHIMQTFDNIFYRNLYFNVLIKMAEYELNPRIEFNELYFWK